MNLLTNRKTLISTAFLLFFLSSCNKDESDSGGTLIKEVVNNYADLVYATYTDAYTSALTSKQKVDALVENPSPEALAAAKDAWLKARTPYGQSEAFRFYGGPIDNEQGPEGLMNAWPLDEIYIDYVKGQLDAGIINKPDLYPVIDAQLLKNLNEKDGEENISTGYHAIEFLLWGQDLSDGPGGGARSYQDYLIGGETANNEERRGKYLKVVSDLLVENLSYLVDSWKPSSANFRSEFVANPEASLQSIFLGIGSLSKGELAGERMFVAWDEKDKEHEHSCFSDNTHIDIINNATGIQNVFLGRYEKADNSGVIDGPGLDDLIKAKNVTLSTNLTEKIAQSVALAKTLQPPFDQEILSVPGRERIKSTIDALRAQADLMVEAGKLYGFTMKPE